MYKNQNSGFTLIELIIAITILSLLSVGLLAALDPLEQFNKARDTSMRNTVIELHNAEIRYQASQEVYTTSINNLNGVAAVNSVGGIGIMASEITTDITALINAGELKNNFVAAAGTSLSSIALFRDTSGVLYTCYRPQSKSFQQMAGLFNGSVTVGIGGKINVTKLPSTTAVETSPTSNCSVAGQTLREQCVYCAQ